MRERPKPFVLPEFCKGCGRCISACALHCIEAGHEIDPATGLVPIELHLEHCTGCGLCIDACPEPYGLSARPLGLGDSEPAPPPWLFGPRRRRPKRLRPIPDEIVPLPIGEPPVVVVKGIYAAALGALFAGCRHFFGYPITPSTEGAELMARLLPRLGGFFLQAVSEVATVNLMYGCGGAGKRTLTFTSSPGLQPDARGPVLHDRGRGAGRLRERDAGRARPRQHRPRAGRHQAGLPRSRPRQHPRHRPRPFDPAGDAGLHAAGLRPGLPLPQPRGGAVRRHPGPDDGQGDAAPRLS